MQQVSALYKSIYSGQHTCELYLTIGSGSRMQTFGMDKIISVKTTHNLFESTPKIGQAVCGEIDIEILEPEVNFERMAEIRLYCGITDGTRHSEMLPKGVYYIDTRSVQRGISGNIMKIHGYDAMLKLTADLWSGGTWDKNDAQTAFLICEKFGLQLDSRTVLNKGYAIPDPGTGSMAYSAREVLAAIGALYGGNWIITDAGKLRLLKLKDIPAVVASTCHLINESNDIITIGGVGINV